MDRKSIFAATALALSLSACGSNDDSTSASTEVKAPSNLKAEPLDGGAHLTWQDNSDNEAEFMIERKTGSAEWTTVATVPFNTTQYHDTGLEASTTYVYRVMAMPKGGDKGSYSNEATCTLPAKNGAAAMSGNSAAPSMAGRASNSTGSGGIESSSAGRGTSTGAIQANAGVGGADAAGKVGTAAAGGSSAAGGGGSSAVAGSSGHGGASGVAGTSSGTAGGASGHDAHH